MGKLFSISRTLLVAVMLMVSGIASPALGQSVAATTRPTTQIELSAEATKYEQMTIGTLGERASGTASATSMPSALTTAHSLGFDFGRMAIALVIVLAMIFGARWLLTHFFAGARAPMTSRAVKVLGRTSLAPRQQVLLLQVGRRIVVVGESNSQLTTLAQIDDPDEVATLVGQLNEEQIARASSFGGFFGRAQRRLDERDEHDDTFANLNAAKSDPSAEPLESQSQEAEAKSELSGLMEKVRSIRSQLGR